LSAFERTRSDLGSRYTPETNIELPIRQAFAGCTRDTELNKTIQNWVADISDEVSGVQFSLSGLPDDERNLPQALAFQSALTNLTRSMNRGPFDLDEKFPLEDWKTAVSEARGTAQDLLFWVYDRQPPSESGDTNTDFNYARIRLGTLMEQLAKIADALESDVWRLANAGAVLISGAAGSGKSHLLADVVAHQIHAGCPALMILGSAMTEGEPWRQILEVLHLPPSLNIEHFLGALDAAGEAAETRVLLCIDAINERNGPLIWPSRIGSFLKLAESFPRVVVTLSCRTTYLPHIVPTEVAKASLTEIEHRGFADNGGRAASQYLAKRGIVRAGAPNLAPEMHIPLFLKTLCDALENNGQTEIPRGLHGISALFEFYNAAVIESVTKRLGLDQRLQHVRNAIDSFVNLLAERSESYAPYAEVSAIFEEILPSTGSVERGLLPQLESEGILTVESFEDGRDDIRSDVRFTFERYADHIVARRLLDEHLDTTAPENSFAPNTPLGELTFGDSRHGRAGIVEAIAVQLPEICDREIVDLDRKMNWVVSNAFQQSFLWRKQSHFLPRTMELARQHLSKDEYYVLLVMIATEPENQFNAGFLDEMLRPLSMPERDETWSAWLMHQGEPSDPVMILIDWSLKNGSEFISEERAELAAITLTWLLSCSNREIRDKATKALASLLATRLSDINDLYIIERLFAGIYGAALQGKNQDDLNQLASVVFDLIFSSGSPPPNELLRDHARCILDYASHCKVLPPQISDADYAPPYASLWPIEHVSDELVDGYKQDYNGAYLQDDIVSSCVSDGDFARYVIDSFVDHFGVKAPENTEPPTYSEQVVEWIEEFETWASEAQSLALVEIYSAAEKLDGKPGYGDSPEHRALKDANKVFKDLLTDDEWGEYRTRAKQHIEYGMFSKNFPSRRNVARFDNGWARRWICKRAHDFGWSSERFSELEPNSSYHRHEHQIERIGKKYQWLAFHELAARMADNLQYFGSSYGDEPKPYSGIRDLRLRDMDPSLFATETYYDGWKEWPKSWWVPVEPKLLPAEPIERLGWLRSDQDVLNSADLISLIDPKSGINWFPLDVHAGWRQSGFEDGQRGMLRETWFRTNCYLVKKDHETELLDSLKGRMLIGNHDLPDFEFDTEFHLGEYPWHPEVQERDYWSETDSWHKLPVPIRATAFDMLRERSSHDYSIDKTINLTMPTPWLVEAMRLQLLGGHIPSFVNVDGETVIFDPSVILPGQQAALVEKEAFFAMLDREDLTAIWVIAGEKGVYGGPATSSGYGGRVDHTGVYHLKDGEVRQYHFDTEPQPPEKDQLLQLLKLDDLPPGLSDWVK